MVRESTHRTYIDVDVLADSMGVCSGGEQRVARIAASLLGGSPVRLDDDIPGLDRPSLDLVLAALAHANGSHEHSGFARDETGHPTGIVKLQTLYPWPDSQAD